jgi:hypothetical protein
METTALHPARRTRNLTKLTILRRFAHLDNMPRFC